MTNDEPQKAASGDSVSQNTHASRKPRSDGPHRRKPRPQNANQNNRQRRPQGQRRDGNNSQSRHKGGNNGNTDSRNGHRSQRQGRSPNRARANRQVADDIGNRRSPGLYDDIDIDDITEEMDAIGNRALPESKQAIEHEDDDFGNRDNYNVNNRFPSDSNLLGGFDPYDFGSLVGGNTARGGRGQQRQSGRSRRPANANRQARAQGRSGNRSPQQGNGRNQGQNRNRSAQGRNNNRPQGSGGNRHPQGRGRHQNQNRNRNAQNRNSTQEAGVTANDAQATVTASPPTPAPAATPAVNATPSVATPAVAPVVAAPARTSRKPKAVKAVKESSANPPIIKHDTPAPKLEAAPAKTSKPRAKKKAAAKKRSKKSSDSDSKGDS